jgi:hypothetical protein
MTGSLNVNLDEKVVKVIGLGKTIARREGDKRLDTVHVLKAAILAYPEEAALHIRQAGGVWSDAMCDFVTTSDGFAAEADRMPVTRELAAIVRGLDRGGQVVSLEKLLKAILQDPSVRVKSLLGKAAKGKDSGSGRCDNKGCAQLPSYASRRDWLTDLYAEWLLRKTAVRSKGLSCGHDECHELYQADSVLDTVARVSAANRRKAEATPTTLDPLASIADDLDELQRRVCECVLVDTIYGLSDHPFGGVPVRAIARMLSPEIYPGNCRKVLDAVDRLKEHGIVAWGECDEPARLTGRVHLAEEALEQLLADIETDAISAGEMSEMKRRIRQGVDWGTVA